MLLTATLEEDIDEYVKIDEVDDDSICAFYLGTLCSIGSICVHRRVCVFPLSISKRDRILFMMMILAVVAPDS